MNLLNEFKPVSILKIGAGTAYVARQIMPRLDHSPDWTLIDTHTERLDLAKKLTPTSFKVIFYKENFDFIAMSEQKFGTIHIFWEIELGCKHRCRLP